MYHALRALDGSPGRPPVGTNGGARGAARPACGRAHEARFLHHAGAPAGPRLYAGAAGGPRGGHPRRPAGLLGGLRRRAPDRRGREHHQLHALPGEPDLRDPADPARHRDRQPLARPPGPHRGAGRDARPPPQGPVPLRDQPRRARVGRGGARHPRPRPARDVLRVDRPHPRHLAGRAALRPRGSALEDHDPGDPLPGGRARPDREALPEAPPAGPRHGGRPALVDRDRDGAAGLLPHLRELPHGGMDPDPLDQLRAGLRGGGARAGPRRLAGRPLDLRARRPPDRPRLREVQRTEPVPLLLPAALHQAPKARPPCRLQARGRLSRREADPRLHRGPARHRRRPGERDRPAPRVPRGCRGLRNPPLRRQGLGGRGARAAVDGADGRAGDAPRSTPRSPAPPERPPPKSVPCGSCGHTPGNACVSPPFVIPAKLVPAKAGSGNPCVPATLVSCPHECPAAHPPASRTLLGPARPSGARASMRPGNACVPPAADRSEAPGKKCGRDTSVPRTPSSPRTPPRAARQRENPTALMPPARSRWPPLPGGVFSRLAPGPRRRGRGATALRASASAAAGAGCSRAPGARTGPRSASPRTGARPA